MFHLLCILILRSNLYFKQTLGKLVFTQVPWYSVPWYDIFGGIVRAGQWGKGKLKNKMRESSFQPVILAFLPPRPIWGPDEGAPFYCANGLTTVHPYIIWLVVWGLVYEVVMCRGCVQPTKSYFPFESPPWKRHVLSSLYFQYFSWWDGAVSSPALQMTRSRCGEHLV